MSMFSDIFKADKAAPKPYGKVKYADPKDGKYPVDTEGHIRAAWSYINHPDNYKTLGKHGKSTKAAIIAAWKAHIDSAGPPSAKKAEDATAPAALLSIIDANLPAEVVQKAAKMWHKDGSRCDGKGCSKAHYEEPWEPGEGVVKADIGSSDLAVAGRLNPEQNEATAPLKKARKMRHGAAFDHGIPPRTASKGDSTRPMPRPDTGLSAPILTGSFASGKGQSTMGVGGTRYDPTAPGKYPSSPDPVSQESVPVGPTYAGAYEKSKNLQKKIKVEALPAYKLEENMSAGSKPATDALSQPGSPNPATLGKGIAQSIKVSTIQDANDGKVKHYMGEDGKHVATAHEQVMWERPNGRGTRGQSLHHSLTLHPDGPDGDKKVGPWLRGKAPHARQVSDLIAENYKPSAGT
jgi:hypothetical protein